MSEEVKKINLFDAFSQTAQTLQQAEEKAKLEKGFDKIDRFRTPDEGEYFVRVLPLAPVMDASGKPTMPMNRTGFEFQLFSMFLDIDQPADKKGKVKQLHIPVIRTTQSGVGMSTDLLEEYVRIAKDMYSDDDEVIDLISGSESRHRIRFSNQHVMYVMDMTDGTPKGPMLWTVSHNNYRDIDTERRSVWVKEVGKADKNGLPAPECPLCGVRNAWPLTVTRTGTKFNDTKYAFKIDRGEDQVPLEESWMEKLVDLPRIPDEIYRYTRYQFEATLEFLRQYDEKHELAVCQDDEFKEVVEKIKGELSPDDNSHFTLSGKADNKSDNNGSNTITLESLNEQYDYILDNDLGKDSDEYEELQGDIQQFIEDHKLDVIVKRSKKISDILDEIEQAMEENSKTPVTVAEPEESNAEESNTDDEEVDVKDPEDKPRKRQRPARPSEDEDSVHADEAPSDEEPGNSVDGERKPRERRRPRRSVE